MFVNDSVAMWAVMFRNDVDSATSKRNCGQLADLIVLAGLELWHNAFNLSGSRSGTMVKLSVCNELLSRRLSGVPW